jgi:nucleolin
VLKFLRSKSYNDTVKAFLKEAKIDKSASDKDAVDLTEIYAKYSARYASLRFAANDSHSLLYHYFCISSAPPASDKRQKIVEKSESSSDSDSDDSESEDEKPVAKAPTPAAKAPAPAAKSTKMEVESESSSDDSSDDDSESSEEKKPVAKKAAPAPVVAAKKAPAPIVTKKESSSEDESSSSSDSSSDDEEEEEKPIVKKSAAAPASAAKPAAAAASGEAKGTHKAYIKGLPWAAKDYEIKDFFKECPGVDSVDIPLGDDGRSSGTAFVIFATREGLDKALELDGQYWPLWEIDPRAATLSSWATCLGTWMRTLCVLSSPRLVKSPMSASPWARTVHSEASVTCHSTMPLTPRKL